MTECKWRGYSDEDGGEPFCECEAYFRWISCEFQEFDYNGDGRINIVKCGLPIQESEEKMITKPIDNIYNSLCTIRENGTRYDQATGITIFPHQRIIDDEHLCELEYYIMGVRDTICEESEE